MSKVVISKKGLSLNDMLEIYATFGSPTCDGPKELKGRALVQIVYVAKEIRIPETGMLGYIDAKVLKETDTNKVTKHHGYITFVIVRRLFRRNGLATKLITAVEDDMKKKWNTDYITVNVRKTNLAAKHLFEHNNYTLDHEDSDAYHFLKQLKGNEVDSCSGKTKRRRHHDGSSSSHVTKGNGVDSLSGKTKKCRHDGSSSSSSSKETKGNGVDSLSGKTKRHPHDGSSSSKETKGNGVDCCSGKTKRRRHDGSSSSKETKGNAIAT